MLTKKYIYERQIYKIFMKHKLKKLKLKKNHKYANAYEIQIYQKTGFNETQIKNNLSF